MRVGIYACAEHEFSIATEKSHGANPFDPLESLDHVVLLKSKVDYVIVLYHGGIEHYRYPSPNLQKVCRKMIEKGADLVVSQHSHCIGCEEKYLHGRIIYGQGNFLFNYKDNEYWNTSLILNVVFGERIEIFYHPIIKKKRKIYLAHNEESTEVMKLFYERSEQILESHFIEDTYKQFAETRITSYYRTFTGKLGQTMLYRIINKLSKSKLGAVFYKGSVSLKICNYIECESHRELLLAGLKQPIE